MAGRGDIFLALGFRRTWICEIPDGGRMVPHDTGSTATR